jgi:anti-sigma factor RsiW
MTDDSRHDLPDASRERDRLLVHAYLDGELDPASAIAIEQRIAADPDLAAEQARVEALRRTLRERLPREAAPPGLQSRVRRAVGLGAARGRPTWQLLAASILIAVFASSTTTWLALQPSSGDQLGDAVVAGHLRGLMAPQSIDVVSSDRHTVKPWFQGKIPQAPRVIDLASDGFPLVGGRIDVVGRQGVPTLVYRRRQHVISLTALTDGARDAAPQSQAAAQGYNLVRWNAGGVAYWAVSDLNGPELETFARLFRDAPAD